MKVIICLLISLFNISILLAQNSPAGLWVIGNGNQSFLIDFNDEETSVENNLPTLRRTGIGIMSNTQGELLFYSDGLNIFNRNHDIMTNGDEILDLSGSPITQESIAIPKPGTTDKYYLFTVNPWNGQDASGLYYAEIDMSLNGGLGEVTQKGVKLLDNTSSLITAVLHQNQSDIWLVVHTFDSNTYHVLAITDEGINVSNSYSLGLSHSSSFNGQMKFSPDGNALAVGFYAPQETGLQVFDFDPSNGTLSLNDDFNLESTAFSVESLDFSSDGKQLYINRGGIYQLSLDDNPIVPQYLSNPRTNVVEQFQLAPDQNIYFGKGGGQSSGAEYLGMIINTDDLPNASKVIERGLHVDPGQAGRSLPNFIQNYLFKTSFTFMGSCAEQPTNFSVTNDHLLESVHWDFGNGETSNALNPTITYADTGIYEVTLIAQYADHSDTIKKAINIFPIPVLDLPAQQTVCQGSYLEVEDVFSHYRWSTGDTIPLTQVDSSHIYSIEVGNNFGCKVSANIDVEVNPSPVLNIPDTLYLNNNDSILVDPGTYSSYEWSDGSIADSQYLSETGWYSVRVTDENGCEGGASFYVAEQPTSPERTDWTRLNPKPTANQCLDIAFATAEKGFIITRNELLKTEDSGETWDIFMRLPIVSKIDFKDHYGYIVGNNGAILKSTYDGGGWNRIETPFNDNLIDIEILDDQVLVVASNTNYFISQDAGVSWQEKPFPENNVSNTFFFDTLTAHITTSGGKILKTNDGGENWTTTLSITNSASTFFTIEFVNDSLGFATKEFSDLYRTVDGGDTWTQVNEQLNGVHDIEFQDNGIGYMCGEYGSMYISTDYGVSWEPSSEMRISNYDLQALTFVNPYKGFATGNRGQIVSTNDGGKHWENYSLTHFRLDDLEIASKEKTYAILLEDIYQSEDQGETWTNLGRPMSESSTDDLFFIDEQVGMSVAHGARVFKTVDGGVSWQQQNDGPVGFGGYDLSDLFFINENIGYVSSDFRETYRTSDGGVTWTSLNVGTKFKDLQFFGETGYARNSGNYYNRIFKSTDNGQTWSQIYEIEEDVLSMHFINETTGYIVGDEGLMQKTSDGGETWSAISNIPYGWYTSVKFLTENYGYVVEEDGLIYLTMDGGQNWILNLNAYGVKNLKMFDNLVYAYGENGQLLKKEIKANDLVRLLYPYVPLLSDVDATIHCNIISGEPNVSVSFVYGKTESTLDLAENVATYNNFVDEQFSIKVEGLEDHTTYYGRFKATVGEEEAFSDLVTFQTLSFYDLVSLDSTKIVEVTHNSASVTTKLTSQLNGVKLVAQIGTASGEYSQSDTLGTFPANLSEVFGYVFDDLESETAYYVRWQATKVGKVINGSEVAFTTVIAPLSTDDSRLLLIYPNPTTGLIKIKGVQPESMKLFNTMGKEIPIKSITHDSLDLSNHEAGTYILQLEYEGVVKSLYVVKH